MIDSFIADSQGLVFFSSFLEKVYLSALTIQWAVEEDKSFVVWLLLRKGFVGVLGAVPFTWSVPFKSRDATCVHV